MHSHLKAPRQEVEATRYCPLDLYSGDEERIRTALRSLWDMWIRSLGQANNLRIFNEGKVVSPIDVRLLFYITQGLCINGAVGAILNWSVSKAPWR